MRNVCYTNYRIKSRLPVLVVVCYDRKHMKRKMFFLVGFIGLVIVVIAVVRLLSNRAPKQGELRVDSQPVATVFINNKNIGKTPYKDKIDVGEYTVKLVPESAGAQVMSWEGTIVIGVNLLTYVNANLSESELATAVDVVWLEKITSKSSELSVTTNPDGATVLVDDATRGVTPLSVADISIGDHSLSITSAGFFPRSLKIKTTSGYRLIANLKLALLQGGAVSTPSATPTSDVSGTPKATPTKTATSSATNVTDPPKPFVVIKDTPTGFLRVREEANTSAKELARVNPGEKYTFFDTATASGSSALWYQIKYDGKIAGWVSGQYVDKVE